MLDHPKSMWDYCKSMWDHSTSILVHSKTLWDHSKSMFDHFKSMLGHCISMRDHPFPLPPPTLTPMQIYLQINLRVAHSTLPQGNCATLASTLTHRNVQSKSYVQLPLSLSLSLSLVYQVLLLRRLAIYS